MRKVLAVLLFLFAPLFEAAGEEKPVARVWAQRFESAGHLDDMATAIAVDASGSVFVAGVSQVPSFQTGTNDWLMIKYSSAGEPLWTNHFPLLLPVALGTDQNGNVFMTGRYYGGTSSGEDIETMAFSGAGALLWTNIFSSPGFVWTDTPYAVASDDNGNIFVQGFAEGGGGNHVLLKYAKDGTASWTNFFSGGNLAGLNSTLCVDGKGDAIVAATSIGTNGYGHYQTVKFASSGTPLWTNWFYGTGNYADRVSGIACDKAGNVYVTGTSWSAMDTEEDIATVAYNPAGMALWTNRFDGPSHDWDQAARIGVNSSGDVIVLGTATMMGGAPPYVVTLGYSPAGTPLWTKYFTDGHGQDDLTALAFDEFGNTLLAGSASGKLIVMKISNQGEGISTNRFSGTAGDSDWASAIAAGKNGDVYVTGAVHDRINEIDVVSWNFATLKYSVVDPLPLQVQLNGEQAVLTWANPIFQLQSTASLAEPFVDVPGAASGYVTTSENTQRYFRLIAP